MTKVFTNVVIGGKLVFVIALIILALINGHKEYVQANPRLFMTDAVITGVAGALAGALLCLTRGRQDLLAQHAFIGILFFFVYHVCREFAGYFALTSDTLNKTQGEAKQARVFGSKPFKIFVGVVAGLIVLLALATRDTDIDYSKGPLSGLSAPGAFTAELVAATALLFAGEAIVLKNHDELDMSKTVESIGMFSIGHVLLQLGGFYTTLYAAT